MVCLGNICRSPMAEGQFRYILASDKLNISVSSAGLSALVGYAAAEPAQALMHSRNIDISLHKARQLNEKIVRESDLILTMEIAHKKQIVKNYPQAHGKVFLLGEWSNFEIPDPYRRPIEDYEYALKLIDQGLADWQKKLCSK